MAKAQLKKMITSCPSIFQVDESFTDERFMKVRINAMCTGINRNNSRFSKECIEAAKDSFANIPILANVLTYTDENGDTYLDYGGHDRHIEDDPFNPDEARMIYDEKVCGVVPETNNLEIVLNEERGEYEVFVDALLYRDYGNYVCDILAERGGTTDVSMEIDVFDVSVNAMDKCKDVGRMTACAITLLGAVHDPAMPNAHAEVFSMKESDRNDQLMEIMQALKDSLDNYFAAKGESYTQAENAGKSKKGGSENVKFEELLEKYGKTAEDVTFEYDGLSDEELAAKFAEAFDEGEEDSSDDPEPVDDEEGEGEDNEDKSSDEDHEDESSDDEGDVQFSVRFGKYTVLYSKSLTDIQNALYQLVNDTYGEADATYYDVIVYDQEKSVVMVDWFNGRAYKQSYKVRKDQYQLTGDRIPVYMQYLTQDEIDKIDDMRSNYAAISDKLQKYEAEPEKEALLQSDDYALISENEEFQALKKQEAHFDLSVEELTAKLDGILNASAKELGRNSGKEEFSVKELSGKVGSKRLPPTTNKVQKRFGSLFDGIVK